MHFHISLSFLCRFLYCFTIFLLYSLCFSSTSSEDLVFIISFFFIRIFIIETYPFVTSALEQLFSFFFSCFINLTTSGLSNHDLFSMNIYACYMLYLTNILQSVAGSLPAFLLSKHCNSFALNVTVTEHYRAHSVIFLGITLHLQWYSSS